jgi:hypothetical protein
MVSIAPARSGTPKSWLRAEIEEYLDEIARVHGEEELYRLRNQVRNMATTLRLPTARRSMQAAEQQGRDHGILYGPPVFNNKDR